MEKLKVTKDEQDPIAVELLERAILDISEAMKQLNRSRLTRRALVALIKDHSGLNKSSIEIVLNNLDDLENLYLKKKEK